MVQPRAIGSRVSDILTKIQNDLDGVREEFLLNLAEDVVANSPVWSGRYVTSHSISATSSAGQFTSNLEPMSEKTSVPQAYKSEGLANLRGDIAALPKQASKIYINNNAPHASIVEHGGVRTPAYKVYDSAINRADIYLKDAVNKVKGRQ